MDATSQFENSFTELVISRRSTRAFLPAPVPETLLKRIFETATYAPSNCNTQPWRSYVVSGDSRDSLSKALRASIGEHQYAMDFPYDIRQYQGVYRERQVAVGKLLYAALGITREDSNARSEAFQRNLDFFDAPHAAFLFMPDWCGLREAADVGMYAQTLLLTMKAYGISSCPQTTLGFNADVVREQLGIDASQKLLFGISFGYADKSKPENRITPARKKLDESTTFFN